jgi:hypothetical protein
MNVQVLQCSPRDNNVWEGAVHVRLRKFTESNIRGQFIYLMMKGQPYTWTIWPPEQPTFDFMV